MLIPVSSRKQNLPESAASTHEKSANQIDATGPYSTDVLRSQNLWFTDRQNGVRHPYSATREACLGCAREIKEHRPGCLRSKCHQCGFFGHKVGDCRQSTIKSGGAST